MIHMMSVSIYQVVDKAKGMHNLECIYMGFVSFSPVFFPFQSARDVDKKDNLADAASGKLLSPTQCKDAYCGSNLIDHNCMA